MENCLKILIISDGKAGHFNQSIAFAKLKALDYDVLEIKNTKKFLTYILDFLGIYLDLFSLKAPSNSYKAIVSTGSETYYANKYMAQKLQTKSIALMLPKGFRYDNFDFIFAQSHDSPPQKSNIIELPINLSYCESKGYVQKEDKKTLGVILGGPNKVFSMELDDIQKKLDYLFAQFSGYRKLITTSRRTPIDIENLLKHYKFDYSLVYSQEPQINPTSDFFATCDDLFISIDSTSMLSEAKANSDAKIHIWNLPSKKEDTKYHKLANTISKLEGKLDFTPYLQKVQL